MTDALTFASDEIGAYAFPEPTLEEELAQLDEEALFDYMNLPERITGIVGYLHASTTAGSHGPRVKYYLRPGRAQPSFSVSVSPEPRVMASSLPERLVRQRAPEVFEFVRRNHDALIRFWRDGEEMDSDQVDELKRSLIDINQ